MFKNKARVGAGVFWTTRASSEQTTFLRATEELLWGTATSQSLKQPTSGFREALVAAMLTFGWKDKPWADTVPAANLQAPFWAHIGFILLCWSALSFSTHFSIMLVKMQQVKHHGDRKHWPKLQQIIRGLEKKPALPWMCSYEEARCSWCLPSNKAVCTGIITSRSFLAHFHLRFWEFY